MGRSHPKLAEIQHSDFEDFSAIEDQLAGVDDAEERHTDLARVGETMLTLLDGDRTNGTLESPDMAALLDR